MMNQGGFHSQYVPSRTMHGPNPRNFRVSAVIVALSVVALLNIGTASVGHRSLSEVGDALRILCRTVFAYPDWEDYWESLFPANKIYDGSGDQRATLSRDPKNIGYFLTIFSCPGDSYQGNPMYDPGHAFYDAAAILKYSITKNTYPAGSKYNSTMYAIIHPDAVRCKTPNDEPYDRVKVLQDLGYKVSILGHPFNPNDIKDQYLKTNLPKDVGDRDFMRLWSSSFDNHAVVVMVDFTTLVLKPVDAMYDQFLNNPSQKVAFSNDYPTVIPATASKMGPNMHFLMMKPNAALFQTLQDAYKTSFYSPMWGWMNRGVKDFDGVLGVKGFLAHYFTRVEPGAIKMLERCKYGNDNSDPYGISSVDGKVVCRDSMDCADCRVKPIEDVKVIKMLYTCGEPWKCSWDDSLDTTTKTMCAEFHRAWFNARIDFETSCWQNGPQSFRTGTYMPDVFMGFCNGPGVLGYDRMIDDKSALDTCDPDTQSNTVSKTLVSGTGQSQDIIMTLTTGKVSGTTTACVSGAFTSASGAAVQATIADFSVTVNGSPQTNVDASKVNPDLTFGTFVVTNVNPAFGTVNTITTKAIIDVGGNQAEFSVSNELPGTLH